MQTICPFAEYRPLPEASTQSKITPISVIYHSDASNWVTSLFNFFRNSSNLESHFHIDGNGQIEQYIPINVRADANYKANRFWKDGGYRGAVSIETSSSISARGPWNNAQRDALVRLTRWITDQAGIPVRQCPAWDASGIGWHIMFGTPGPWTPVAKSCPGPARIKQVPGIIEDVAYNPPVKDTFMAALSEKEQRELLTKTRQIHGELFESVPSEFDDKGHETQGGSLRWRIGSLMTRTSDLVTGRRPK